jgi:glycosyltransferase involved in cell wall biosynthesis
MRDDVRELIVGASVPSGTPSVSIIIPNYNSAKYISETLDSVFSQTFQDFEVIVINDGSPDTAELQPILEPYFDKIVFIDKPVNSGTSATRNLAAEHSRADILAFLDGDDIWHPEFLEKLLEFKLAGGFQMAYAAAETFGLSHGVTGDILGSNPVEGEITREMLVRGQCLILPSGSLIDAASFRQVGGFDPQVSRTEDFDLWMRSVFAGVRIGYLRKVLFRFRISATSGSGDSIQRIRRCRDIWITLQEKLPFTEEETAVVESHIAHEQAALLRAEGRYAISRRDWKMARQRFRSALRAAGQLRLPVVHRARILLVCLFLYIWPGLVRRLQNRARPDELALMPGREGTA